MKSQLEILVEEHAMLTKLFRGQDIAIMSDPGENIRRVLVERKAQVCARIDEIEHILGV